MLVEVLREKKSCAAEYSASRSLILATIALLGISRQILERIHEQKPGIADN